MSVLLMPPKKLSETIEKPSPPTRTAVPEGGTESVQRMANPTPLGAFSTLRDEVAA